MITKTDGSTNILNIRSREMNSSQLTSMAMQKDISEKELIEDQNKTVKENIKSQTLHVYAFRQKAAIFGHDAPSYKAINIERYKFRI